MMKLIYMVNNTDNAAQGLLENWPHDQGSANFWRASSNYIYRFSAGGDVRFLRIARQEERSVSHLQRELDLLLYLKSHGFSGVWPLKSANGNYMEKYEDQVGVYHGMVFEGAPGRYLTPQEKTDEHFKVWGKTLAQLHDLSQHYIPEGRAHSDYNEYLALFTEKFKQWQEQPAAVEAKEVARQMNQLPATPADFGLIHYDFQDDNIFWNQQQQKFYVIDFDDCHYNFYAVDIFRALADVLEQRADGQRCLELFLEGYALLRPLPHLWQHRDLFSRYEQLMHFYVIQNSLEGSDPSQDPAWLVELRPRLVAWCDSLRENFVQRANVIGQ